MRLERASPKAVRYAIMNWHYSKAVPPVSLAFSVFEKGVFCGVVCYGLGATSNIGRPFGLTNGQCIELVRVALNGKQGATSKALALSLKLVKKHCPLVELVVSYADSEQGHIGSIYQATNWTYIGSSTDTNIIVNGERVHRRTLASRYGTNSVSKLKGMGLNVGQTIKTKPKHKYCFALTKRAKSVLGNMAKPYPKQAHEAEGDEAPCNQ